MNVGVDIVAVERFRRLLKRSPRFTHRFFTAAERSYSESTGDPPLRLAGTFAAKEAVMKALGLTPAPAWARRIEIVRTSDGSPRARTNGHEFSVSISHDGGFAIAVAAGAAEDLLGQ
jgi:holo-[acyl-carrier protein] synthase